jgi:hypothetical protein
MARRRASNTAPCSLAGAGVEPVPGDALPCACAGASEASCDEAASWRACAVISSRSAVLATCLSPASLSCSVPPSPLRAAPEPFLGEREYSDGIPCTNLREGGSGAGALSWAFAASCAACSGVG